MGKSNLCILTDEIIVFAQVCSKKESENDKHPRGKECVIYSRLLRLYHFFLQASDILHSGFINLKHATEISINPGNMGGTAKSAKANAGDHCIMILY